MVASIGRVAVVFQVLLHHFFREVARAPGSVANCPEMLAPVPAFEFRILELEYSGGPPFEAFDQVTDGFRRWILNVHVYVIFADYTFENLDVFGITDLDDQFTAAHFDVALQDVVTILGYPDQVCRYARHTVAILALLFHRHASSTRGDV